MKGDDHYFSNYINVDIEKTALTKAMDEIKNRLGPKYITKANTLHRVEGNTHFLERNN